MLFLREMTYKPQIKEEIQPDMTETGAFCSDQSFFFFFKLGSWYYFFLCLYRQMKGTFHSTCQEHATEATGGRQSFKEQ